MPKHRQEETGIKRIRRRELLSYPDGFFVNKDGESYYSVAGFGEIYNLITDGRYGSSDVLVHYMNLFSGEKHQNRSIFKKEGLYFQDIMPRRRTYDYNFVTFRKSDLELITENAEQKKSDIAFFGLHCSSGKTKSDYIFSPEQINDPFFIFGIKNKVFMEYLVSITSNKDCRTILDMQGFRFEMANRDVKKLLTHQEFQEKGDYVIPCIKYPGIKPLRWCHSELALIPTKNSLNILFFETGDDDKKEKINE